MWLSRGDPVRWNTVWGTSPAKIEDGGETLDTHFRYDREHLISGLFQGCEGMNVGGTRKLRIAPHLAFRETGVPGSIPPYALLTAEIHFLSAGLP
jgi:FKBP-type peptidyl-prolyl cis-trans isomerase